MNIKLQTMKRPTAKNTPGIFSLDVDHVYQVSLVFNLNIFSNPKPTQVLDIKITGCEDSYTHNMYQ